jgi:hypothetical protein
MLKQNNSKDERNLTFTSNFSVIAFLLKQFYCIKKSTANQRAITPSKILGQQYAHFQIVT